MLFNMIWLFERYAFLFLLLLEEWQNHSIHVSDYSSGILNHLVVKLFKYSNQLMHLHYYN